MCCASVSRGSCLRFRKWIEALAVRRGDLEFLAFLNDWIQGRSDDGWLKTCADQWFGNLDWAADK